MKLSNAVGQAKILSLLVIVFCCLFIISLLSNVLLSCVVFNKKNNFHTIIQPMVNSNSKYELNEKGYDMNYLKDMGTSFVSLRLNLTPELVKKNHGILLSYFDNESRPKMADLLDKEANIIIGDDLSTAFYIDSINLYPAQNIYEVKGKLRSWSRKVELPTLNKTYQLEVSYKGGLLKLKNFVEVSDVKDKK